MHRKEQERALDAAAAREIALELHSPRNSQVYIDEPQPQQAPAIQRDLSTGSPLVPPKASYMSSGRKSVSPHPEYDDHFASPPPPLPAEYSNLERTPTYTEHPTISVQQYDTDTRSAPLASQSPPSQYGTPLSYASPQPPHQQVADPYGNRSGYEQEYNPYEERSTQLRSQGYPVSGGGEKGAGGYDNPNNHSTTKSTPPPFDAQPPNAPYMRSATGTRGSNSSLTGSLGSPTAGSGAGKISAAAFKRPSPRPGPNSGLGSAFGPPSPTVGFGNSSPVLPPGGITGEERLPSPYGEGDHLSHAQSTYGQRQGQEQQQPLNVRRKGEEGYGRQQQDYNEYDDAQEDYYAEQHQGLSPAGPGWAGVGSGCGGGGLGPGGRGGAGAGAGGQGGVGGYGQGKFATNLEDLR